MKYIIITVILFMLMFVVSFTNIPYRLFILSSLVAATGVTQVMLANSVLKRKFTGQLIIKKNRSHISLLSILVSLNFILLGIAGDKSSVYNLLLFLTAIITVFIANFSYSRKNTVSIVVKDNELLINGAWITKRDIDTLTAISLNGFSNKLTFSFIDRSSVSVDYADYRSTDMADLISYLHQFSKHKLYMSENIKTGS